MNNKTKIFCPHCSPSFVSEYSPAPKGTVFLIIKEGKFGKFAGCPNFPKCKHSVSLKQKENIIDYEDELRPY
uniref:Putative topoisomerase DNA binding C4 zinc finger n=1 Tax=viral metagenome TaxID=1070528 RepID=A0A6M3KJ04_9ZZZZ